jgi:hypothetical protein
MGVVLALGTLDTALTILDCGMRISDWRKNERRTSNVQHRMLNEKQMIGRGRS